MQSAAYTAYVSKLGLTEAIAKLKTANDDFNAAYSGRSSEKLTRVSIDNMKAIRPKVDDAYRAVVSAINTLYQVNELVARNAATSTALGTVIDGQWQYDQLGRVTESMDVKRNVTRYEYDCMGRVLRLEEPDGNEHRFRYYSPETENYISQDPIGLAGNNPTFYGYVNDSNS